MPDIKIDTDTMQEVGNNIRATKQGDLLILVVDTKKEIGPSKSGNMVGNGSTGGFAPMPGGLRGNIYIGRNT